MDVRRQVPRTDAVLADPLLAPALQRLDRTVVKAAVAAAQQEVRAGRLAPEGTPAEEAPRRPRGSSGGWAAARPAGLAAAGAERDRCGPAHEPRPGAARTVGGAGRRGRRGVHRRR